MIATVDPLGLFGPPAVEGMRRYVRGFFRFEERLAPSRWCERHLRLPPGKQETKPGAVNFAERPFLREPLDSIADPTVTDEVFVGPTRIGKTFILRMAVGYTIAGDPASAMWVDSTVDKGRDVSRKEIQPLIEYNAILRDRKPKNRHNYSDARMLFPAAAFTIVGGNSAAGVAGDTVKRVFGNELDKWSGATEKEASVAELVRHRTESFDEERKHFWSSTPTLEEMITWTYYRRGDQRTWRAICPDCGDAQALVWDRVCWADEAQITDHKWDLARVKETARYHCVRCDSPWTDEMRLAAIRHPSAHYLATATGEPGWRSHHVNGLYGPLKTNNVGAIAVAFLSSRTTGFFTDRQDFWNSVMGLPWKDNVADITVAKFAALEREYQRGQAGPEGFKPDLLIIEFDVQSNRIPYVVRTFAWSGESYLVDHGDAATWTDLDKIQAEYSRLAGTSYVIGDINYEDRRAETLEQIYRRRDRGWFGAEGFEKTSELVRIEKANVFAGGREVGRREDEHHTIQKLVISTYDFKVELEKRLSGAVKNFFYYQLPLAASESEIEEQREYYKQRLDEHRRPRKRPVAGKPAFEFVSKTKNNHFNDCEVYGLALFWILQKRRAYATRKGQPADRRVVEVKTN
jgi:hypothetical protein